MNELRQRADRLLVSLGFFESRARAQAAIDAGLVTANGAPVRKASQILASNAVLVARASHPYVSRGGVKLRHALDHFAFSASDRACLDVGASTGGFSDVLLRDGARIVYAVDTGQAQLHDSLRDHARIRLMEGFDARRLSAEQVPEPIDLTVVDVSFISLKLVLPAILPLSGTEAALVALIKPQFEVGRAKIGKGGIVRDDMLFEAVCSEIGELVQGLGWSTLGIVPSPIVGGDGNREFLIAARRGA